MTLKVKHLSKDRFSRPRLQNIETGRVYADVSCGDARFQDVKLNIPGYWHTTSRDGEPECPLRGDVEFELAQEAIQ